MYQSFRKYLLGSASLGMGFVHFMADDDSIVELDQNLDAFADFELLPKGGFPGECVVAEKRVSDSGNEYYYTNWRIDPADYPDDYDAENNPEGTTLNYSRVQVPSSTDRRSITNVKRLMAAMGLPLKTKIVDPSEWVGKRAKIIVGVDTYNGERRNSITRIESLEA